MTVTIEHNTGFEAQRRLLRDHNAGVVAPRRRQGDAKLSVRERVNRLLDPGTPFLEIGLLAAHDVYDTDLPAAALVVGIGSIHGRPCMVFANDPHVKGGTYYPLTIKKQLRGQKLAREYRLPCVYLADSGGIYLPLQEEIFPDEEHLGKMFRNIAEMSALGLPQISAVLGICTAGGAYIPAMCDETVMVKDLSTVFLGGPQLVEAATGIKVDAQTLGGADLHVRETAVADHLAANEAEALAMVRDIVARTPGDSVRPPAFAALEPADDPALLPTLIPATTKKEMNVRAILRCVVDATSWTEYRKDYGITMVCATARIAGYEVGIVANQGVIFPDSALKATNFIQICNQRRIPLLFVYNVSGFMVGEQYERAGIAKHGAKMVNAVSCATVPKISLVIGGSFGAANFAMSGRSMGGQFMAMWPNARSTGVGGEQAAAVMAILKRDKLRRAGKELSADEEAAIKQPIIDSFERQSHPAYIAARMWIDAVVEPEDTRTWLAQCLSLAHERWDRPQPTASTFGVFRL
ncbi:3-methylcrotonyl-CoA carboxylase beta subunit [Nocardia tenerifensis]|uniref:3-methylcrotonyl-CoA carboxylase beta subunit n=1 Tax=Nocardia tenerifensis TaxID=228006 RepID=A0A318JXT5_9NOCA|nr:carboxyl transferase domain-containing protein [Nocardia tenerifensis]PXX62377.1 3-methylcrotonyl-CoA carboxylase beta subunit [Nocardia tenerifensis]